MGFWEILTQGDAVVYLFPFLLIFTIIFALLTKINIFGTKDNPNKGVNAIISIVVALIAIQFKFVSSFFSDLFPRMGISLALILVILIFLAFIIDFENKYAKNILTAIVVIAIIAVFWVPFINLGFRISLGDFFKENLATIIFILFILGVIIWAVMGGGKKNGSSDSKKPNYPPERPYGA